MPDIFQFPVRSLAVYFFPDSVAAKKFDAPNPAFLFLFFAKRQDGPAFSLQKRDWKSIIFLTLLPEHQTGKRAIPSVTKNSPQ